MDHASVSRGGHIATVGRTQANHQGSSFQQIIEIDRAVTSRSMAKLLTVLLRSAIPDSSGWSEVLRPLWAEEAMHRSYCFLKLALALHERPLREPGRSLTCNTELCLATDLAALYRSLATGPERQVVPCSPVLRDVVRNLVALFGSIVGDVELHVNIGRVALPAFQRRALVLAASELVINALCHAFRGRTYGRISLELHAIDIWKARLQVSDDGVGCEDRQIDTGCGIAGGLASLLESELAYRIRNGHGTTAEIMLPLLI
jgi:hypothetical protein